jgi:hypothetical protein
VSRRVARQALDAWKPPRLAPSRVARRRSRSSYVGDDDCLSTAWSRTKVAVPERRRVRKVGAFASTAAKLRAAAGREQSYCESNHCTAANGGSHAMLRVAVCCRESARVGAGLLLTRLRRLRFGVLLKRRG